MLEGVEVWGIRWQQQRGPGVLDELRRFRGFVKGRVVPDDQVHAGQTWAQPYLEPGVEHLGIARAVEEDRFCKLWPDARGNERGARSSRPGRQAVHAVSLVGIPLAACDGRREAALIDRHELQAATSVPLPKTQQRSSLQRAALCVAGRFSPGPPILWRAVQMQWREPPTCRAACACVRSACVVT